VEASVRREPRARGAGPGAIEAVYRRRFAAFMRVALAVTGDPETARDAVQEGFARALAHRAAFRGEGPLEAWLWRAVVNCARDARRVRPALPLEAAADEHLRAPASAGGDAAVRAALAALPERQRMALFLRHYADLDYRGIAAVLGVRPGTVGATLSAAHASLRRQMEAR
jgi:RNA polymerase sigma factor (sigma-70 family)